MRVSREVIIPNSDPNSEKLMADFQHQASIPDYQSSSSIEEIPKEQFYGTGRKLSYEPLAACPFAIFLDGGPAGRPRKLTSIFFPPAPAPGSLEGSFEESFNAASFEWPVEDRSESCPLFTSNQPLRVAKLDPNAMNGGEGARDEAEEGMSTSSSSLYSIADDLVDTAELLVEHELNETTKSHYSLFRKHAEEHVRFDLTMEVQTEVG